MTGRYSVRAGLSIIIAPDSAPRGTRRKGTCATRTPKHFFLMVLATGDAQLPAPMTACEVLRQIAQGAFQFTSGNDPENDDHGTGNPDSRGHVGRAGLDIRESSGREFSGVLCHVRCVSSP